MSIKDVSTCMSSLHDVLPCHRVADKEKDIKKTCEI